jgi:hypothetical protein
LLTGSPFRMMGAGGGGGGATGFAGRAAGFGARAAGFAGRAVGFAGRAAGLPARLRLTLLAIGLREAARAGLRADPTGRARRVRLAFAVVILRLFLVGDFFTGLFRVEEG